MSAPAPAKIFYVYAKDTDKDRRLLVELDKHLDGMETAGQIERRHAGLLLAGDDFEKYAGEALAWAQVLLLLVSADCLSSSACMDLLDRAQNRGLHIVPVLIRAVDLQPYAVLRNLVPLPHNGTPVTSWPNLDEAFAAVAAGLRVFLGANAAAGTGRPLSQQIGPSTTGREALRIALRLDRTTQWEMLSQECDKRRHTLFLLFGYRRQNLWFFLDRIRHYLADERRDNHMVIDLPWQRGEAVSVTGTELAVRLKNQLALELNVASASLRDLIKRVIEHRPLLLIIGENPIDELPPKKKRALQDFLTVELPGVLRDLSGHPVRVLLCVDYLNPARSCVKDIAPWAEKSAKKQGLHYCQLPEALLPDWSDVRAFLDKWDPPLSKKRIEQIHKKYDDLHNPALAFHDIAHMLDRELREEEGQPR